MCIICIPIMCTTYVHIYKWYIIHIHTYINACTYIHLTLKETSEEVTMIVPLTWGNRIQKHWFAQHSGKSNESLASSSFILPIHHLSTCTLPALELESSLRAPHKCDRLSMYTNNVKVLLMGSVNHVGDQGSVLVWLALMDHRYYSTGIMTTPR